MRIRAHELTTVLQTQTGNSCTLLGSHSSSKLFSSQKRGVMNVNGTLPYFPYRDDGLLLWKKVGQLAKKYVDL